MRIKKTAAIVMLVSFIFATAVPAMADYAGIAKGSGFTNIGDERTFAGYSWTLYAKDSTADASGNKYGYIITSDVMDVAKSDGTGSVTYQVFRTEWDASDANKYSASELRTKVNTYETAMKSYSGTDMTWEEANGTAAGKNYIVKHDMTKTGTDPSNPATYESPYGGCGMTGAEDDLLYVLSTAEAQALYNGTAIEQNILKASDWYWLRSPGYNVLPLTSATAATSSTSEPT